MLSFVDLLADISGLKPFQNSLKELGLPLLPSILTGKKTSDPIFVAAKFKRLLGKDTFFSVQYMKDLTDNTKNIILIFEA